MAKTTKAKFAFQCKNCGAVEPAEAAGDNPTPSACHICRAGVRVIVWEGGGGFNVTPDPANWIVLAQVTAKELAADFKRHGLTPDQVAEHKPKTTGPPPKGRSVVATAEEKVGSKDRS